MSSLNRTINNVISSQMLLGSWRGFVWGRTTASTTAATITSGYISCQRIPQTITVPSTMASGVNGIYLTKADSYGSRTSVHYNIMAEYQLASLAVSGNVSSGTNVTIPSREVMGETVNPVGQSFFLAVNVAMTATTPVITISYTNQEGTSGRTATMTLPTNSAINTAYYINPHLQSGDTGILSVQDIDTSTGSAGTLTVYGCIMLNRNYTSGSTPNRFYPNSQALTPWLLKGGDTIAVYSIGDTVAHHHLLAFNGIGDV